MVELFFFFLAIKSCNFLFQGAVIGNLSVSITPVDDYLLPPEALPSTLVSSIAGTQL